MDRPIVTNANIRFREHVVYGGSRAIVGPMAHGTHLLLELNGCPFEVLNDEAVVRAALRDAADAAGAAWLGEVSHAFDPAGVTAVGLLAQSHISIHTWPEMGYAAVDVFTCGDPTMPEAACNHLIRSLQSSTHSLMRVARAIGPGAGESGEPPRATDHN